MYSYSSGVEADTDTSFYGVKNGLCSIQRAINSCTNRNKKYNIYCFGNFNFENTADFFLGVNGNYYYGVEIPASKRNIRVIGEGIDETIISGSLPDDLGSTFPYNDYITIENNGDRCKVENMTALCQNMRYATHSDVSSTSDANNNKVSFINVKSQHLGNTGDALIWQNFVPYGLGVSSGEEINLEGCELYSAGGNVPLYIHDNVNFTKKPIFNIKDTSVVNVGYPVDDTIESRKGFSIQLLDSGVNGEINLNNVNFNGNPLILVSTVRDEGFTDYKTDMYFKIKGTQNEPMYYWNQSTNGKVLRIKSLTTSIVRFNESSNGFSSLISGNLPTNFVEDNGIIHYHNYRYFDGENVLKSYAVGELCLDNIQNQLGDCSVNNKKLGIYFGATYKEIIFANDYTSYSESDVLNEINSQLSGYGIADLYVLGCDYYPEFDDVAMKQNTSYTQILRGMGVKIIGNIIQAAESDTDVDGICIDDVKIGYSGRVVTKGLFATYDTFRFYIKIDVQGYPVKGTKFGISDTAGVFTQKDGLFECKYNSIIEI